MLHLLDILHVVLFFIYTVDVIYLHFSLIIKGVMISSLGIGRKILQLAFTRLGRSEDPTLEALSNRNFTI